MQLRWPTIANALLAAAAVGLFTIGGHFAAMTLIATEQASRLNDLVQLALRRTEVAVDYGYEALEAFSDGRAIDCDNVALQALRLRVYQRGPVKDIRIAGPDGTVRCSAYSETLEFDRDWARYEDMLPSRSSAVRLFRVDQFFGTALGVFRLVDEDNALIAILAVNASLLDVMPAELRQDSDVVVELVDGLPIAKFEPENELPTGRLLEVSAVSDRFPLRSVIRVSEDALLGWNREVYWPMLVLSSALGLALGLLLGRMLAVTRDPIAVLDRAIARREFIPYLQPIFELASGKIVGCEMLARWHRPDGSVLPPSRFINLAEDSGRIAEMTWHMFEVALSELRPLMRSDDTFRIAVNIAPSQFLSPGFTADLRRVVAEAHVARRQIVIELTEREELSDLDRAVATVAELQDDGFQVAIDDVGIGHSGLSNLQRLGANVLKIDKFFIDSINHDETARSIVEMLVRLAAQLKMSVVAEGVENRQQIGTLLECGVSKGQGYVVAPPLPIPAFLELVTASSAPAGDATLAALVA